MSIESIVHLLMWVTGGIIGGLVFLLTFAFKISNFMIAINLRVEQEEGYTKHFIKTGENIKDQLAQHELVVSDIRNDLKWLKESQERILKVLEK